MQSLKPFLQESIHLKRQFICAVFLACFLSCNKIFHIYSNLNIMRTFNSTNSISKCIFYLNTASKYTRLPKEKLNYADEIFLIRF